MGYMRHHAIIVTGTDDRMQEIRNQCEDISYSFGNSVKISMLYDSKMNHYQSFFVAPDGSKEGWGDSYKGDEARNKIIEYLDSLRYSDNSTSFKYVEVQYGDDDHESKVLRHSEDERFKIG